MGVMGIIELISIQTQSVLLIEWFREIRKDGFVEMLRQVFDPSSVILMGSGALDAVKLGQACTLDSGGDCDGEGKEW